MENSPQNMCGYADIFYSVTRSVGENLVECNAAAEFARRVCVCVCVCVVRPRRSLLLPVTFRCLSVSLSR